MQSKNGIADRVKELKTLYELRVSRFTAGKKNLEVTSGRIAAGRLVLFILMLFAVYLAFRIGRSALLIAPAALFAGFLYLVKQAVIVRRKMNFTSILIKINRDELSTLNGDYSAYEPGSGFIDYHHPYSFDLDIFGAPGIFQLISRANTPLGREKLAACLLNPGSDASEIRLKQQAVREMVEKLPWRQDFLAIASESEWEEKSGKKVGSWLDADDRFSKTLAYPIAIVLNSCITLTMATLFILTNLFPALISFTLPPALFIYFLVPVVLIVSLTRRINMEQQKLERLLDLFRKYTGLLQLIEKEEFSASYSKDLKKSLELGGVPSSQIMKKLTGILWGLEVRGNLIVSFFLNSFFLWDILLMLRLERWRKKYRKAFGQWTDAIAEFEILNSLATFSFNRPDLTWPEILDGDFRMEIVNGGHPMINLARRVDNSLTFDGNGQVYLITGANMAGKSTLLRMAGVNMILAMSGGPVCADRFSMVPVPIHTSVRTNDSLGDDESYFYAELKKLGLIISRLEKGEKLFVIIDEMLKGTNSHDKHTGSAALIRRLFDLNASGLVATHDVELGNLESEYPGRLINRCFEVICQDDHLEFDYLLYPGISKSLNATFLMRKMGIIRDE